MMNLNLIRNIKEQMETPFEEGGYKLKNTHFENGRNLHSEQYYYAKKFFQNSKNCDDLSKLLSSKIIELNLEESTTLIGFRNYSGLLLNKTINILGKYNYAIVEFNGNFLWQHLPTLGKNLVIILPVTCTCSTYIKLRNFIINFISDPIRKSQYDDVSVSDKFINVFLILEQSVACLDLPHEVRSESEKKKNPLLYKIYSAFNWVEITHDTIVFNNRTKTSKTFTAHPLIRLYSKMHLPESCDLCFPKDLTKEKFLFPTHDNFETPNLIFGFPNFTSVLKEQNFYELFSSSDFNKPKQLWNIHLYGRTVVNDSSYMSYIRGDEFYDKNKELILLFFSKELKKHLDILDGNRIIFITPENKHSSSFIEDISSLELLRNKSITILRFDPSNEFIDNFISLHGDSIKSKNIKVFFFEEVLSAGKTFKLISDYIKHIRNNSWQITNRHGFDLVITLVDRTLLFTRDEIIKKIFSNINNEKPEKKFISYFKLNAPIISASHMGDPLNQREIDLKIMRAQSHLDTLKIYVNKLINLKKPINLEELEIISQKNVELDYFPFKNYEEKIDLEVYTIYDSYFNKNQQDLLKLNLIHEINSELAEKTFQDASFLNSFTEPLQFAKHLIDQILKKIEPNLNNYFVPAQNRKIDYRDKTKELKIVHDSIVKILTRHPFVYYKSVYEAIFHYCTNILDTLFCIIERNRITKFENFRELKFYIRRSIELNSNFIISKRFILCIKNQYTRASLEKILKFYEQEKKKLKKEFNEGKISAEYCRIAIKNLDYQSRQVSTYFAFLLYCYKELIYKNPYRSIKLEELINSEELLPHEIVYQNDTDEELEKLIKDPYYHFTGMIKAENIHLLNELKNIHKERGREFNWEKEKCPEIFNTRNIYSYLFQMKKNDPVIVNAKKLIEHSRFSLIKKDRKRIEKLTEIRTAICEMLNTVSILESKKLSNRGSKLVNEKSDPNFEIKEIVNSIIKIIQPGIPEKALKYAFFVEFRNSTDENKNLNNIYTVLSEENIDNPEAIILNKQGLIYNLIYGLYNDINSESEQSLVVAVKLRNNNVISFNDKYFYKNFDDKIGELSFSELYKNDLYNDKTGQGLKILDNVNMSIAFRFSEFIKVKNNGKSTQQLKGQAVLLIMNTQECKTSTFLDFFSNEKVRLLLLIKEEILEFLQKWFDNDSFIEIIENRKKVTYQRHLRHGFSQYLQAQSILLDKIVKGINPIENREVFNIITDALKGQIKVTKLLENNKKVEVKRESFVNKFRLVFQSEILGNRPINFSEVNLEKFNFDIIEIHPTIFDVIIPELIINMKKYSPLTGTKGLKIEFDKDKYRVVLINTINPNLSNKDYGGGEGLKMCNHILYDLLKISPLIPLSQNGEYIIILNL